MANDQQSRVNDQQNKLTEQQARRQLAKRAQHKRYVVSVDHQNKSSYDTREAAETEAQRIRAMHPILTVEVADSEMDSVTMLGPTFAKEEPEEEGEGNDGQ